LGSKPLAGLVPFYRVGLQESVEVLRLRVAFVPHRENRLREAARGVLSGWASKSNIGSAARDANSRDRIVRVRWLRVSLMFVGVVAVLSGIALFQWGNVPETAFGWVLLPLGGAALLLVEALAEGRAGRVRTFRGLVLWTVVVVLFASALAVAWTLLA